MGSRLFSSGCEGKRPPAIITDMPPPKRTRVVTPSAGLVPSSPQHRHRQAGMVVDPYSAAAAAMGGELAGALTRSLPQLAGHGREALATTTSSAILGRSFDSLSSRRALAGPPAPSSLERSTSPPHAPARAWHHAPPEVAVAAKTGRWTKREDEQLRQTVSRFNESDKDWKVIAKLAFNGSRSDIQCLERWEKVLKLGLVKGPWTPEEDEIVRRAVEGSTGKNGGNSDLVNWADVAKLLPGRLTKQVRERWQNHLNPALVKSPWTEEEDYLLVSLQAVLGNRWNEIARAFQGRSENAIKNRWNSKQRRTLLDGPKPHKPILPTAKNVCRNVNFHKALVKASGNDPEINEAASILVNKVSRCVAVQ
ncbi:hypothetical protein CTAYLR_006333 [Chrysophaeum taylorii]|uniref:Uncharacterized protein n=1 Tax=Chrysophaeum taylorii TaxID=2483200 RepID=A0AAD7U9V9_9STRA|nr:hypothetical protein CTAYLR_006333 [Chrysophaeum taylorii]